MVAKLKEADDIMNQGSHGNQQQNSNDRHESNHEFNMFLDREIQKNLLGISEKVADRDSRGINIFLGTGNIRPKGKARQSKYEEFCAWTDSGKIQTDLKKTEKSAGKLSRDKDASYNLWKDFKPKQINYIFKHYPDAKRYIEQYRYEHTYNFGPLSREPIEITTCKIVPINETQSPSQRAISERGHHNPFRRIKPSPSHPNLAENGIDITRQRDSLKHAKSEPNIEDIVQSCLSTSPNVFTEPVPSSKQSSSTSKHNGYYPHHNSPDIETNSVQSHVSHNGSSPRPGSSKSVRQNRPTSPWVATNGKLRSPTRPDKTISHATTVSLDTVPKLSPLQVLQVKTKGASAIHSGALPLFQGKTMKVVSTSSTTQSHNTEVINMTGKVHSNKVAPIVTSTPNVKTLDMLSQMHTPDTPQQKDSNNHQTEANNPQSGEQQTGNKKTGSMTVKDPTTVNEASHNLKQGTDKEHYQTLVSELSYLDISTSESKAAAVKALEAAQKQHFDVTGLTMSFAQKYEIRELGFSNGEEMVEASDDVMYDEYGSDEVLNGSGESEQGSKAKELSSNQSRSIASEKKPHVQLERVSKNRASDLKKDEIQKINEIKTRMNNRKKEGQVQKIGISREPKTSATKTEKSESQTNGKDETQREKQKSRVSFKMHPEVIDIEEDSELLPVAYQQTMTEQREVSSPDAVKPAIILPQLNSSDRVVARSKSRTPSRKVREPSPDKAAIMRRYFMDIAEREGDEQLLTRLQQAPDHSFKPASAGDATEKIHALKHRHSMDDARVSYEEKPHSSPSGAYIYSSSSAPTKGVLHNYSRLAPSKVATRQKSFYNTRTNPAAESDKKFLKDLNKLSKLKEIYMKTREKTETNVKTKLKQTPTVLHKMQTGHGAEMEGVDNSIHNRSAVMNSECRWSVVAGYCL